MDPQKHLEIHQEYNILTNKDKCMLSEMYKLYTSQNYSDTYVRLEYHQYFQTFYMFGITSRVGKIWDKYIGSSVENIFLAKIKR